MDPIFRANNDADEPTKRHNNHCLHLFHLWVVAFVVLWNTATACCLETRCQNFFDGTGVTSLHSWNEAIVIAGTKAGRIHFKDTGLLSEDRQDLWNEMGGYESRYPIYSLSSSSTSSSSDMKSSEEVRLFFGGGGDRWISVWKSSIDENRPRFHFVQRLGPHTGWVKDLAFDGERGLLHSIGCNCIESWDCKLFPIRHISKRLTDNSPTMGSTLSSDLLCLCIIPDDGLLATGGVDGRIHLWLADPSYTTQVICSIGAHKGRVNSLTFSSLLGTLFSVSHDGSIQAYKVSQAARLEFLCKLDFNSEGRKYRMSSALILSELKREDNWFVCNLAVGSSGGDVMFVTAEIDSNRSFMTLRIDDRATVGESTTIYALLAQHRQDVVSPPRLYIGHATGLATLDLSEN